LGGRREYDGLGSRSRTREMHQTKLAEPKEYLCRGWYLSSVLESR
jgi:hypothetical protein